MSKPFSNPFFETDMSKMFDMSKFEMPKFDMSNMSKMMPQDCRMPQIDPESILKAQRKNIEAYTSLSQAMFESYQSLWRRQAEMMRQTVEETSHMMNSIMSLPTPEDKVMRQAEISKSAMEKCLANVRDITDTMTKCNSQAIEAVSNRMNESLDELRGIIKSSRAA